MNNILIRNEVNMKLSCRLSTLMGESRYSIQDVHEKSKLSRTTISHLYYDNATRIDYKTITKLCCLFKCDINDLFSLENTSEANDGK